jgi:hypothetical protein
VESSCELGNEPSDYQKCWETTEWLHNLWPVEWYSAELVSIVVGIYNNTNTIHLEDSREMCSCIM